MNAELPSRDPVEKRLGWYHRRRQKIADEIERNRRGEYKVPTWVLAAILGLLLAGWLYLIITS